MAFTPNQRRARRRHWRGRWGERLASFGLQCQGYQVLGRNVRAAGVEVDIVAWRRRVLYIVEVKTRTHGRFGAPECAVDRERRRRQWRAASVLVDRYHPPVSEVSFGIAAIEGWRFRFYSDAWGQDDL